MRNSQIFLGFSAFAALALAGTPDTTVNAKSGARRTHHKVTAVILSKVPFGPPAPAVVMGPTREEAQRFAAGSRHGRAAFTMGPTREEAQRPPPPAKPGTTIAVMGPTLEEARRPAPQELVEVPNVWSPEEISDAKARCAVILKRIEAVAIAQSPIREGACGAPAPIQLISIGKSPEVAISPPATVTCELAEGLYTWLKNDLQPLAKRQLGADIVKIENMSDYSCRTAYGRAGHKLSEHGHANALDIRGFVTSTGKTAYVLENWGKPQREIVAELAAAKAAAEKAAAEKAAADKSAQDAQISNRGSLKTPPATPPVATASASGSPAAGLAKSTIIDGIPKLTVTLPGARQAAGAQAMSLVQPERLGGPKRTLVKAQPPAGTTKSGGASQINGLKPQPPPAAAVSAGADTEEARRIEFLHLAHAAACRIFGTTLGPEANADHRNHFHVDMAERKVTKICD